MLEVEDALPLVAAEWMDAGADKPTVLVYGHLDLQLVPEPEWETNPHEAVRKGDRLYARGAADDMGGWVSHMAALRAWFEEAGTLPCNVRLVIEGEEEIGSPNLERYMDAYPDAFEADLMVLTDCEALDAGGHSGLWGGSDGGGLERRGLALHPEGRGLRGGGPGLGDLPLILDGVMDLATTAHGPNESLHLGVFRKAIAADVYLLDEIGALGKDGLG